MYVIEKNVPIPAIEKAPGPYRSKYPFRLMQVGDSIAVPKKDAKKVISAAHGHGRAHGKKFLVRTNGEVVRIWRVAA